MKTKFWLSITLIIAACGLTAYIMVFETGWVVVRGASKHILDSAQVPEVIKKAL